MPFSELLCQKIIANSMLIVIHFQRFREKSKNCGEFDASNPKKSVRTTVIRNNIPDQCYHSMKYELLSYTRAYSIGTVVV